MITGIKRIPESEIKKTQVEGNLPDKPSQATLYGGSVMTPEEVKAAYDKLPKLIVAYYNALVDYLADGTGFAKIISTGIREGHTLSDLFGDITSGSFASYLALGDTTLEDFYLDQLERNTAIGEAEPDETLVGKAGGIYFHQNKGNLVGYVCVGTEGGKYIWKSFGSIAGAGVGGISPTVEIIEINGGHRVTITDADGPKSFDVMSGQREVWIGSPETKPNGYNIVIDPDGEADSAGSGSAISPTIEVSKSGGVTTLTITDANGRKTVTINDGKDGVNSQRGTGVLKVTTAPTTYTTSTGGKNPIGRMSLSTIKTQAGVNDVLVGDLILNSYYLYHIYYLDATYAYMDTSQNIRGAAGEPGKDGENSVSPLINVTTIDGGHRVTISDANGERYFDVMDGISGSGAIDTLWTPVITLAASTLRVSGMTSGVSKNITFYKDGVVFSGVSGISADSIEYDLRGIAAAWDAGTYSITVKCSASGYYDSGISNAVNYEVVDSTPTLWTPVVTLAASTIRVSGMTSGVSKNITFYKDGVIFTGVSGISADSIEYDLRGIAAAWDAGTYSITVQCTAIGYHDSGMSNAVEYVIEDDTPTLWTPVLTISGKTLKASGMTSGVSKTLYYYKDGVMFTSISNVTAATSEYTISYNWSAGTHAITVKCTASGYHDSGFSNAVNYTVT